MTSDFIRTQRYDFLYASYNSPWLSINRRNLWCQPYNWLDMDAGRRNWARDNGQIKAK